MRNSDQLDPPDPIDLALACRHFDAECAFNAALSRFQSQAQPVQELTLAAVLQAARPAFAENGFSWLTRQDSDGVEVCLRHSGGAEEVSSAEGSTPCSPALLLAGLLGILVDPTVQGSNPEQHAEDPGSVQAEPYAGCALSEPEPEEEQEGEGQDEGQPLDDEVIDLMGPDSPPEISGAHPSLQLLTPEQIDESVGLIRLMTPPQRKSLTIAFRSTFNVPRTVVKIAGEITQLRHLEFIQRFSLEANDCVSP